jgi:hypothetical protein
MADWNDDDSDPVGRGLGLPVGRAPGVPLAPRGKWCPPPLGSETPCCCRHCRKAENVEDPADALELGVVVPAELAAQPVTASAAVSATAPSMTGRVRP